MPISALLDHDVLRRFILVKPITELHTVQWGDTTASLPVAGLQRIRYAQEVQREVDALPTIGRLAREQEVAFYRYAELEMEDWRGWGGPKGVKGDLLRGIEIVSLEAAIERSKFRAHSDFSKACSKEEQIDWVRFLLAVTPERILSEPLVASLLSDIERRNVEHLARFKELCGKHPEKHYPDLLHLWTAEVHGLDYFLTMDGKFVNLMTRTSTVHLTTRPITPLGLLAELGIDELDPAPVEKGVTYNWFDET